MKIKIFIYLFGVMSCVAGAHAASMCTPAISGYTYTTTDSSATNNRGQFALDGTCTADNTTRTITCTKAPDARGESHCSASGTYPAANWETGGKFCWCRLTDVTSSNGYLAPRAGGWVFRDGNLSVSDCASVCAYYCAGNAQSQRGFRRALFASPGLL